MTFILGLGNQAHVILISDRRLTCNGKVTEDESNKTAIFSLENAQLAVAFTGLAQSGTFLTRRWLLEALLESANPDHRLLPTIDRFSARATEDFRKIIVSKKEDKSLTVVLAGYQYDEVEPLTCFFQVSNFEKFDGKSFTEPQEEFRVDSYVESRPAANPPSFILAAGVKAGLTRNHIESLRKLLQGETPSGAVVGKGVEVLRAIAQSPLSKNLVGKQCTSITIPSRPEAKCLAEYHSSIAKAKIFAPSLVDGRGGAAFIIDSPEIEIRDSSGQPSNIAIPKVGRNAPCPCKSGMKYKRCCATNAAHRRESKVVSFGKK